MPQVDFKNDDGSTLPDINNDNSPSNNDNNDGDSGGNNIVAAAMMKLPADQLAMLRNDFNKVPWGLSMYQFVSVMMKYSEQQVRGGGGE